MTAIGTAFSYYGGKVRLSKTISDLLPPSEIYVEAFAGSAAVLLSREPSRYEVLNDLDGEVHNFWVVLRDHPDELIERLERTPYGRRECAESLFDSEATCPVERARRFFVLANMSFNSKTAGGYSSGSRGKSPKPATLVTRVDRLSAISNRLRKVELQDTDALRLIDIWDSESTLDVSRSTVHRQHPFQHRGLCHR